jgi:hypothetical protein
MGARRGCGGTRSARCSERLDHRAIQVGLGGEAVEIHALVVAWDLDAAGARLPQERPYELPADMQAAVASVAGRA